MSARTTLAACGCLLVTACTTIRVPLCPDIAKVSYGQGEQVSDVNRYAVIGANRTGVAIAPLSSFTAEASGFFANVNTFNQDYKFMVCAFEPDRVLSSDTSDIYINCMSKADNWATIVNSNKPEDLMLEESLFRPTCAAGRN